MKLGDNENPAGVQLGSLRVAVPSPQDETEARERLGKRNTNPVP